MHFSSIGFAQCNRGIMSIFEEQSIEEFISATSDKDFKAGANCLKKLEGNVNAESYCNCLKQNPKTDYEASRKLYRKKLGTNVKSKIFTTVDDFKYYKDLANNENVEIELSCKFTETIGKYCTDEFISEMFNRNSIDELSSEIKTEYFVLKYPRRAIK